MLAWAAAPPKTRGAHARISPPGESLAILGGKDVQNQGYTLARVGRCPPGHAEGQPPGPSLKGGHLAWSQASATKCCQEGKSRGTFFWGGCGGESGPHFRPVHEGREGGGGLNEEEWEESAPDPCRNPVSRSQWGPKPRFSVFKATFRTTNGGRYGGRRILHAPRIRGEKHPKRKVSWAQPSHPPGSAEHAGGLWA